MTRSLDTTAVSALMRLDQVLRTWIEVLPNEDEVLTCVITRGEVLYGIERLHPGQRRQQLEVQAARVFSTMRCLPVPEPAAEEYARLKTYATRAGVQLSENDLWIAGIAAAIGAALVTADADFTRVPNLQVDDWTNPRPR